VTTVHDRYATVQARRLFYREPGSRGAPDVVLLHGFPASSFMFRDLIPLLAVWGRNDQSFIPEGALAFADDAPGAEIYLLDGGHFLLESHLDAAAGSIRRFLQSALP
jgi:pimeloyl-ACP methyl ester carboxylesterase